MLFKPLLTEHFTSTSAHGIPKLMTAKSTTLRVLWISLVLAALFGFTYNLRKLTLQFLSYPINYHAHLRAAPFECPDIYICNPMTFSGSIFVMADKIPTSIIDMVDKKVASLHRLPNFNPVGISNSTLLTLSYFSTIDPEILNAHVHSKAQTIINGTLNGIVIDLNSFEEVPHSEYFNCFKFLNTSLLSSPFDELILQLFTDASPLVNLSSLINALTYKGIFQYDMASGLVLLFTKRGIYPGISAHRVYVSAGMRSDISISVKQQHMFNKQSQACSPKPSQVTYVNHLRPLRNNSTISFTIDYQACVALKWSMIFYKQCGCIPLNYPVPVQLSQTASWCLNMTGKSAASVGKSLLCTINIYRNNYTIQHEVQESCRGVDSCQQNLHKFESFNTMWPAVRLIPTVIKHLIIPMYELRQNQNYAVPGWKTMINVTDKSELIQTFRSNVLKVTIRPEEQNVTVWKESPAYPVFNFLSDIGGILGLYMGMSLLTILELIELAVKLCNSATSKKYRPTLSSGRENAAPQWRNDILREIFF